MISKKNKKFFYSAQGFVEALLAILITGIGCIVFMTIAARTIADVVHNEKVDLLTQEAVKGSIIVSNIVEEWNFGHRDFIVGSSFLNASDGFAEGIDHCYALDGDVSAPYVSPLPVCPLYDNGIEIGINPSECAGEGAVWGEVVVDVEPGQIEDTFRVVCVDNSSNVGDMILAVRIYTGFRACNTLDEIVREVSDVDISCDLYEYIAVYKLEPTATP